MNENTQHLPALNQYYDAFVPPEIAKKSTAAKSALTRFVHYTTAETGLKILTNAELWMRNASTMNDLSDVRYGLDCIHRVLDDDSHKLRKVVNDLVPGIWEQVKNNVRQWSTQIWLGAWIASISEHNVDEDDAGRLSMWRAYGQNSGVAIVINPAPIFSESNVLHVYAQPVLYMGVSALSQQFDSVAEKLASCGKEALEAGINLQEQLFQLFGLLP
jgi:hypothetical protein